MDENEEITYRIINDIGEEIIDPDLSLGYLKKENILIVDLPKTWHYEVDFFLFDDGYKYIPVSRNDPHVKVVDPITPIFTYNDLENSGRKLFGTLIKQVVDQEETKEYETVYRYIRYTPEELTMKELPARMDSSEENINNLSLDLSDLIEITAELSGSDIEERVDNMTIQLDNTNARVTNTEDRITDTELTVEDLLLFIADFAGGAEEEEEEL